MPKYLAKDCSNAILSTTNPTPTVFRIEPGTLQWKPDNYLPAVCNGNLLFNFPTPEMEASNDLNSPKLPLVAYNGRLDAETQH
jgi:hypothetical protein